MAKKVDPKIETFARIKVVGVGGAGGSAINRMIDSGVSDVEFIAINTDAQALHHNLAEIKVNIGPETTRGLGAGGDPKIGQDAAQESIDDIKAVMEGADILFITFGAGGGTGSGAAHVIAQAAREMDILTVAFVTRPFGFEVDRRARNAEYAISNLEKHVDTLVIVPNDNLLNIIDSETPVQEAFKIADDVLRQGVQGITDLITVNGLINLDFADVKSVMQNAGQALMGIGRAGGENRAEAAAQQAINSPLLEVSINGAKGILFNVIGGNDMTMHEINAAAALITEAADQDVNVIFGATINPDLEGEIIVTVIATGFHNNLRASMDLDAVSQETKSKNKPVTKITSLDELPSLPVKNKPKSQDKKDKEAAADDKDDEDDGGDSADSTDKDLVEDIKVEDIVKDIDPVLDDEDDDKQSTIIDDEDADDSSSFWDDVDDEDGPKLDLNKPAFLRNIMNRKRQRKKRKEAKQAEEDAASADDSDDSDD